MQIFFLFSSCTITTGKQLDEADTMLLFEGDTMVSIVVFV